MANQHEFAQMADIAKAEIERDAPKYAGAIDLSAGKTPVNTNEAAQIVAQNWQDPQFRSDLVDQETPDRVIQLLLLAQGVTDQDTGKPMTVAAYKSKVLQPFLETGQSAYIDPSAGIPSTHAPVPVHPIMGPDGAVLNADPSAAPTPPAQPAAPTPATPSPSPTLPPVAPAPASAPLADPSQPNGAPSA